MLCLCQIYELEGLRFRRVEYMDNQDIIDLVEERRNGVLALLNEVPVVNFLTCQGMCDA